MLEVKEFLKLYVQKLKHVNRKYIEALRESGRVIDTDKLERDFDERMSLLYKPQFVSTLGNQDVCAHFLVDDFELLAGLPRFDNAEKQDCSFSLIPYFDFIPKVNREYEILLPESYSDEKYLETIEKHPVHSFMLVKFDVFLKFELGLSAHKDFCKYVFNEAAYINDLERKRTGQKDLCSLKVLPVISLDWSEITVFIHSTKLEHTLSFLRHIIKSTAQDILVNRSIGYIQEIGTLAHAKFQVSMYEPSKTYTKRQKQLFCKALSTISTSHPKLKKFSAPLAWKDARLALENDQEMLQIYALSPESITFNAFKKKWLKRQELDHILKSSFDAAFLRHIHLAVFTNTFIGIPLNYSFYLCGKMEKPETPKRWIEERLKRFLYDREKNATGTVFRSIYNWAPKELYQQAVKSINTKKEANLMFQHGSIVEKSITEDDSDFSTVVDVPMYHFGFHKKMDEIKDYSLIGGKNSLRNILDNVRLKEFIDDLIRTNRRFGNVLFASTCSSISFPFNKEDFSSSKDDSDFEKTSLRKFTLQYAPTLIYAKLKRMKVAKYLRDNFLEAIDLYNHYVKDPVKFENLVEATPVIWKVFQFFDQFDQISMDGKITFKKPDIPPKTIEIDDLISQMEEKVAKYLRDNLLEVIDLYKNYIKDPVKFEKVVEATPVTWMAFYCFDQFDQIKMHGEIILKKPPLSIEIRELISQMEEFVDSFKGFFQKRCLSTRLDPDYFQSNTDKTTSSHLLLHFAAGSQRILLTYLLGEGSSDYVNMSCLITEDETDLIYHKNSIVPKTNFSRRHLLSLEHIGLIFHEVGHAYILSSKYSDLEANFQNPTENLLLKLLFQPPRSGLEYLNQREKDDIELLNQVVPDLYFFFLGCQGDLQTFVDKFLFHKYYCHNFPRNDENLIKESYLLNVFWLRAFFVALVEALDSNDSTEPLEDIIANTQEKLLLHTLNSKLSGNTFSSVKQSVFEPPRRLKNELDSINKTLVKVAQKVKILLDSSQDLLKVCLKIFRFVYVQLKNQNLYAPQVSLSFGKVEVFKRPLDREFKPATEIVQLLENVTTQTIRLASGPTGTNNILLERADIDQTGLSKARIHLPGVDFKIPQNPGPVCIHPSLGAFAIDPNCRAELFRLRAGTMLSLHHLILQEKGVFISHMLNLQDYDVELTNKRISDMIGKE